MPLRQVAGRLSKTQRDFLIDHVDGVRPIGHFTNEDQTRNALLTSGLIRYEHPEAIVGRPKGTMLTERGREVVCIVLGEYADALVRWGYIRDKINLSQPDNLPMVAVPLKRPMEK